MNSISKNYEKFIESIKINDIKEAKSNFIFEYFNNEDKYGLKPIHWACLTSNMEILEWMLQEKCDIETSSRNGWRPIHFASFIGNEEMVQFLKDKSSKIDCKTDNGKPILVVANVDCNHEFIDEILNENINLKIGLSMGLKCGIYCKHEFCLRSLIRPECFIIENYLSKKENQVIDSYSNRKFVMRIREINDYGEYEYKKCIGPKINEFLQNLNHSNIIKYYGLIEIKTKMILFTECIDNESLRQQLKQIKSLDNSIIYRYCKDILQAIAFLHDNKILHRFIRLSKNIFIDNNGVCKLIVSDYSYSLADGDVQIDREWWKKYKRYSLTAPELVKNGTLSYPYDIWLFGCTMIEMSTRNRLDYQIIKFDEIERVILEISNNENLQSFIRRMVMENPTDRSTAKELLNHRFMRNIDLFHTS